MANQNLTSLTDRTLEALFAPVVVDLFARLEPMILESLFDRCNSDEYPCNERGTITHLESELGFCPKHFQAVR